ncbi:MAG: hypothetical protein NDI82_03265, partial [Anaeromyxobacteraceae bacterium]|nr:hypothetical protein [Anaeromyxobacteraceae bacterium]
SEHGPAPSTDDTCTLSRVVESGSLRLEVWTCASPTPRPPTGDFTVGVFRRGELIPARELWPGSIEAWSCNTGKFPGHLDLVLYLGGEEEASRCTPLIMEAEARREADRIRHELFVEQERARIAAGHFTRTERWAAAAKVMAARRAASERRAAARLERIRAEFAATAAIRAEAAAAAAAQFEEFLARHQFSRDFQMTIGRRRRRVFHVSRSDAADEDATIEEAGWYFTAARPRANWLNNDPIGPYPTLRALLLEGEKACSKGDE